MASNPQHGAPRAAPRLYLVTPPVTETATLADIFPAVLAAADIAAVLLRLAPADERSLTNRVKALAPIVQGKGVALIVDGHPEIVARAGADGCHLSDVSALRSAAAAIKPARILGAGGLKTRHDAMSAGEAGADYVMFGEPDADGLRPSFAAIVERVAWWAEVFEIPCVAFAEQFAEVEELCAAGADFIALGDAAFSDPRGCVAAVGDAAKHLTVRAPA
jgi:thiamine-phosphate pyrophosphorylase